MIHLKEVSKSYGKQTVLKEIDLCISKGKVTSLIGPSGCGKSTILRMIIGLIEPTTGHIEFDGEKLTSKDIPFLRRQMGYVVQDGGLFPHLNIKDNVSLMAKYLKKPTTEINKRLKEMCQLAHFPYSSLKKFPFELSGGEKQRVSLMRALMLDPRVLLLDEPLGALDPMVRSSLQTDLKEIFKCLNKTVVFVTHDMGEAGYLGDEIVLLSKGEIIQKGTLNEFLETPNNDYVTEFITAQRPILNL